MKKKAAQVVPEEIHLFSINIFRAQMNTSDAFLEEPKEADSFKIGISNEMAHNVEDRKSRCRIYLTLQGLDKNSKSIGLDLEYAIEFHYQVENFDDFFLKNDQDELQMDAHMAATLLAMSYSTARGIVYERTRGTFFNGVLLPVINPYEAIHNKLKKEE